MNVIVMIYVCRVYTYIIPVYVLSAAGHPVHDYLFTIFALHIKYIIVLYINASTSSANQSVISSTTNSNTAATTYISRKSVSFLIAVIANRLALDLVVNASSFMISSSVRYMFCEFNALSALDAAIIIYTIENRVTTAVITIYRYKCLFIFGVVSLPLSLAITMQFKMQLITDLHPRKQQQQKHGCDDSQIIFAYMFRLLSDFERPPVFIIFY